MIFGLTTAPAANPSLSSIRVTSISKWVSSISKKLPKVLELKIQATAAGLQAFFVVMELEIEFGKRDGQSENAAFLVSGAVAPSSVLTYMHGR
jgi:hypothetical protein